MNLPQANPDAQTATEGRTKLAVRVVMSQWVPAFLTINRRRLRTQARFVGLAVLVGLVAGLGAILFHVATIVVEHYALGSLAGYHPQPRPAGESTLAWLAPSREPLHLWLLVLVPAVGGLVSGLLVFTLAPEAEGHGTDAVIAAYHLRGGQIRPRVPLVKIVASAITIGTGGSGGREGPIAQIGAGFGALLANLLHLRPVERRILLAAGMGAGIAAIFRAPLAGALFAAEVLYGSPEFEPEVIMPAAIASVVSYCTFGLYAGWQPLFAVPDLTFADPRQLLPYSVLALFMALLAMLYTRTFYGCTALFRRLPVPRHLRPSIGAALAGLVGVALYGSFGGQETLLAVLSFGYNAIQGVLSNESAATASVLLAVALGKIATTSLTIGSGGSGGVFGPSMVIGGCGGGALGIALHAIWPALVPHPASYAIVGMAGFFAAAAKTPFSTLVIVSEMTGGYYLLLPSLWVCTLAFMLSDVKSIYSSQVESRSRSPAHQGSFVREVLAEVHVSQFLTLGRPVPVLRANDSLTTVLERLNRSAHPVLPVVDAENRLLGVVNLEEVHLVSQSDHVRPLIVAADLMRTGVSPLQPADRLDRALELFVESDLLALPVVEDLTTLRVLALVRRYEIAGAYLQRVHGGSSHVSARDARPRR